MNKVRTHVGDYISWQEVQPTGVACRYTAQIVGWGKTTLRLKLIDIRGENSAAEGVGMIVIRRLSVIIDPKAKAHRVTIKPDKPRGQLAAHFKSALQRKSRKGVLNHGFN